jgi:uncharacterized membrane protein (DUF373 family)
MGASLAGSLDDEGLPAPKPVRSPAARWLIRALTIGENLMFTAVAVALFLIAVVVFVSGSRDALDPPASEEFAVTVTKAVNSVLFIVIVLELLRTVVARLDGGGFQLQPFLVIGIISASRHILTVGAQLSLVGEQLPLTRTMVELSVNAAVVLALATALVLVRRFARVGDQ